MIRYKKNPRKGSGIVIEVDRVQYQAKYIGKGSYSKVYRVGDRVVYFTRGDCGKEVLAQFQYDRMAHLPEIIRHDNVRTRGVYGPYYRGIWYVFSSPYYRNVTKKDRSAWELMIKIIRWYRSIYSSYHQHEGIWLMQHIVDDFKLVSDIPRSVIKALQEIVDVASNCGSRVGFDLHKKNFGVNEYGTLIFRDPIYVRNK